MTQDKQLSPDNYLPVQAWLSYRCKHPPSVALREQLRPLCDQQAIRLVYDQNDTEEGDDLIAFMADLSAARCIFIFLCPAYFQSAYTLYELISIHECPHLEQRFILPLRVSNDIVANQWTALQQYWQDHRDVRNSLARLLKTGDSEAEHLVIWQRITAAWDGIVFPYLDKRHQSAEDVQNDQATSWLAAQVAKGRQAITTEMAGLEKELTGRVKRECLRILDNKRIPVTELVYASGLATDSGKDALTHLLEQKTVDQILDILIKLSLLQEQSLAASPERWALYLHDVEQLAGWLLIRSIDPAWWFEQSRRMKAAIRQGVTSEFSLTCAAYVEVVISRSLLQQAHYTLDAYNEIVPASDTHDVMLFDAVAESASDIELLTPLYKDLRRSARAPQEVNRLLDGIGKTARGLVGSRDGKPVYYLVSPDYFGLLQTKSWFGEMERTLAGYLHFVCCRLPAKSYQNEPCALDAESLLEKMAILLRMRNSRHV